MSMTVDLSGQVAVVTGGAGILGQAVVRAFYRSGARVVVVDRTRDQARQVFGEEIPEGDACLTVGADLTDEASVAAMAGAARDRFGRIDILVNIAGGFASGAPLHETLPADFDFMFNLNVRTMYLVSRAVVPIMLEQSRGKIINVGAKGALSGAANKGPYIASKMAVIRLTESMDAELRDRGINVNAILPSTIDTPRNRADMPKADPDKWVTPDSMAQVILFLVSDAARDIHGASIPVYGRS
jgi:NAD(P)-dependent dehydrogenase (short-subunit alcohol dehydrogenase family)